MRRGTWCPRCKYDKQKKTIEDMQSLASKLGGKCLSSIYVGARKRLKWECGQGHCFEATPSKVKLGRWCRICGNQRAQAARRTLMSRIQELAMARNGKCLSESYTPGQNLKWQCEHGHVWEADLHNVKFGKWCPVCGHRVLWRKPKSLEEMRSIAHSHGGKCLSTSYQNADSKMEWECKEGHTWFAISSAVKKGHWCPECAGNKRLTIEDAQELALSRGGKCLSVQYDSTHEHLKWQCSEGHTWMAQYANVNSGNWCPECSAGLGERICREYFQQMFSQDFPKARPEWLINSDGNSMELDGYCEDLGLAFEHQGLQHYRELDNFLYSKEQFIKRRRDDLSKRLLCQEHGITLIEVPQVVYTLPLSRIQQYIIEQCTAQGVAVPDTAAGVTVKLLRAYSPDARERIEAIHKTAFMRGGTCLSPAYLGATTPLRFRCSEGHEWETIPGVIIKGHWCHKCAALKIGDAWRLGVPAMQSLAASRGGRCLSTEYVNANAHLLWQCKEGHQWKATPHTIKSGRWCPKCARSKRGGARRLGLAEMQAIAASRGGRCLSDEYINANAHLLWQCKEGHQWKATPHTIKSGRWCPKCARSKRGGARRLGLAEMQAIAASRGGRCLSDEYINANAHLLWQCKEGHQWKATPDSIKSGHWCLVCGHRGAWQQRKAH